MNSKMPIPFNIGYNSCYITVANICFVNYSSSSAHLPRITLSRMFVCSSPSSAILCLNKIISRFSGLWWNRNTKNVYVGHRHATAAAAGCFFPPMEDRAKFVLFAVGTAA